MTVPLPLAPGNSVAPGYEVIRHLRRGKNLDVYDVWSTERACRCIVKSLRSDRLDRDGPRARLLEEGRLLCELTHPHLVRGYETLTDPIPAVVMETLSGDTLAHLIEDRQQRLGVEELAHLGLHLAAAVRYLHKHGYLHLDLKPSNIIAECGRAKLIDLSVARPPGHAHPGIGTWNYLAPEQARGEELGPAADVWGVGVVLYEAATGLPAFDDPKPEGSDDSDAASDEPYDDSDEFDDDPYEETDSDASVDDDAYPQLTATAARIDELRAVPRAFADLVAACLEREPQRRPDVAQLLARLEPFAALPVGERRHTTPAPAV